MIQFFVLLIFTLIVGTVLYFYPPNIPLKFKMTLLGLASLLALGGLFVLDNLSYGLALAAIIAIAFVASYIAEKRMNFVPATSGQTEIVLSFSEEEPATEKADVTLDKSEHKVDDRELESAVTIDELTVLEEIDTKQDEPIVEKTNTDEDDMELREIELTDLKIEEVVVEDESNVEIIEPLQEMVDIDHQLTEITEDEFAFLTETREISEEDVMGIPVTTDIEDEEILLHRAVLLEELDDEKIEEEKEEELPQNLDITPFEEVVEMVDEPHNKEEESVNDSVVIEQECTAEISEKVISELDTEEDFAKANELTAAEEIHPIEEPNILEEILSAEGPEQVELNPDVLEKEMKEPPYVEIVEEIDAKDEVEELTLQEDLQTDTADLEEDINVQAAVSDMNDELQDMLLNTLDSYHQQGDNKSYQEMASTILNQSLSDKDFYLFSKLLLNSYASSNEFARVGHLLGSMEARLNQYPVIAEELQRYKEFFLVKN